MLKKKLELIVPEYKKLWYRKSLMENPGTMSYNKGYDLGFEGYDNITGCILFPEADWKCQYDFFVGNEPERFYAYIKNADNNEYIGEVNLHRNSSGNWYDMGILIESKFRGKGYSKQALNLLLAYAFDELGIEEIHNDFENSRESAKKLHLSCGFKIKAIRDDGIVELNINRQDWEGIKNTATEVKHIIIED